MNRCIWGCVLALLAAFSLNALALDEKPAEETKPEQTQPAEEKKPEQPKPEEKPAEQPKPEEKPAEEKKPEEKPAEEKKPEEKKPEEKKPEEKKPEVKPAEEKKPEEKKPEEKPAEEKKPEEAKVKAPVTAVRNLDNPSGVVVHSGTGHVFVASRYGVYRYDGKDHKIAIEVAGYPTDIYGKGPMYNIGPLGLAFLNDDHLIVGDGSRVDGEELMRVYKVGATLPEKWQKEADAAVYTLGPIKAGDLSAKGEGNFYGVAVAGKAIFTTCNGDDTKGWIAKSVIGDDGKPGELVPTIATKEAVEVDAPVGITVSPDGKELVVSQMGEMTTVPGDSLLTKYNPADGKLIAKYETGLLDIAGLAYSPKTGKLYAVDFAWADAAQGGLFELTIEGDKVTATKIYALDKPTALAFDKDGKLYVTVFGTAKEGDPADKSPGSLLVFEAGL